MTDVVFPFVPVTPISWSRAAGRRYHASAAIADGRRLPVRSCHADQLQSRRRPSIPRLGGDRGGAPAVPHHDLRNGGGDRLARFDERRGGATRRRIGDELMTVEHGAAYGAEQHPGLEPARIGGETGDLR